MENRRARQTRKYFKDLEKLVLSNINRLHKQEFGGSVDQAFQGYESILEKYLDIVLEDNGKDFVVVAGLSFRTVSLNEMPENVKRRLLLSELDALRRQVRVSGDMITDTTRDQIANSIQQNRDNFGKMVKEIQSKFKSMSSLTRSRARTIARTEIQGVVQLGSMRGAIEGQATHKQWVWSGVEREIHADINGQTVEIDKPFTSGSGNQLMYPGDPSAPPIDRINCYCDMIFLTLTAEEAAEL